MQTSDVQVHSGEIDTSMDCKECGTTYQGRVHVEDYDLADGAARMTIDDARDEGWEDGPTCPDCARKGQEDDE